MKSIAATILMVSVLLTAGLARADQCGVAVTPPEGGFAANNLSGYNPSIPLVTLELFGGDASYVEIATNPEYVGSVTWAIPADRRVQWSLNPGYDVTEIWIRFRNSCQLMPSTSVLVDVHYWPSYCDAAPTGTSAPASVSGYWVRCFVQLNLVPGDAAFAEVSNHSDFSGAVKFDQGYGYDTSVNWTLLPGFGVRKVYVRYLNPCENEAKATTVYTVTVNRTWGYCPR
jgi:hypothetical protein